MFSNSEIMKSVSGPNVVFKVYVMGHLHSYLQLLVFQFMYCECVSSFLFSWFLTYLYFPQSCTKKCVCVYIFKVLEANRCEIAN